MLILSIQKNTLTIVLAYVQAWFFVDFVWSYFAREDIELVLNFAPVKIVSWLDSCIQTW